MSRHFILSFFLSWLQAPQKNVECPHATERSATPRHLQEEEEEKQQLKRPLKLIILKVALSLSWA